MQVAVSNIYLSLRIKSLRNTFFCEVYIDVINCSQRTIPQFPQFGSTSERKSKIENQKIRKSENRKAKIDSHYNAMQAVRPLTHSTPVKQI